VVVDSTRARRSGETLLASRCLQREASRSENSRMSSFVSALCLWLALISFSGTASATNYQCRLPLVTTSEFVNGGPKTETARDDTVVFVVRVSPAGDFAVIDGVRFQLIKGPDYLAFFGAAVGMSSGVDVLTIYDTRVSGGQFSVESRQVTISGKPIASQMVGVCVRL
jgi:hypothetical protein